MERWNIYIQQQKEIILRNPLSPNWEWPFLNWTAKPGSINTILYVLSYKAKVHKHKSK